MTYLVTRYIYRKYPNLPPGAITEYRTNFVSNQFLSAVTLSLGIEKLLFTSSVPLQDAISKYSEKYILVEKIDQYWHNIGIAPKAIADLYEALLGAIYLDSGFDIDCVESFLIRTAIDPWLHYIDEPSAEKVSPISQLNSIVQLKLKCRKFSFMYAFCFLFVDYCLDIRKH